MILWNRRLRRWYTLYNRLYFGGNLPEDTRVVWTPLEGTWGQTYRPEDGPHVIEISPACGVDSRIARLTILHEMVHVSLWPCRKHGARFEREMQRLAAAGAMKGLW